MHMPSQMGMEALAEEAAVEEVRASESAAAREAEEQTATRVHQRGAALEWMRVAGVEPVAYEGVGGDVAVEVEVAVRAGIV